MVLVVMLVVFDVGGYSVGNGGCAIVVVATVFIVEHFYLMLLKIMILLWNLYGRRTTSHPPPQLSPSPSHGLGLQV